jgi:4-hydroxy-tetrahydrodipicolinate synthase
MAMPPHILHPDAAGCYEYFSAINAALDIPICVQNYAGPAGTPMSNALVARMCQELEHVEYIKEETLPEPRQITLTLQAAGDACKGVFGGQGGNYLIDEWRRGACGNMPASQLTDLQVRVWNLLEAGDEGEARKLFNIMLPLISFERMHGVAAYKEIMYRRGIFKTRVSRAPGKQLDDYDRAEVDAIWADVSPHFSL